MAAGTVSVPLPSGQAALIDAADAERVSAYRWHVKTKASAPGVFYAQTTIRLTPGRDGRKSSLSLHRFLLDAQPGDVVDHRNGNGLDNRRANLRITNTRGNSSNIVRSKNQKRDGFKGVSWNRNAGKWEANVAGGAVRENGKRRKVYLGLFDDAAAAARAYDEAAIRAFGAFACLNFPESGIELGLAAALAGDESETLKALTATANALGMTEGASS